VLQFVVGVVVLGEHMSLTRWVGFAIVWVASIVLTVDMVRTGRRSRRPAAVAPAV